MKINLKKSVFLTSKLSPSNNYNLNIERSVKHTGEKKFKNKILNELLGLSNNYGGLRTITVMNGIYVSGIVGFTDSWIPRSSPTHESQGPASIPFHHTAALLHVDSAKSHGYDSLLYLPGL
jgi:hypothetical protein